MGAVEVGRTVRFDLPAELVPPHTGESPTDSAVRVWESPDLRVVVDEGPFADPLTGYATRGAESGEEVIDGHRARVVSFVQDDGGRSVGAHFDDLGAVAGGPGKLTVVVTGAPGVVDDVALGILRSIRFAGPDPLTSTQGGK